MELFETAALEIGEFLTQGSPYRSVLLLIASMLLAYWLSYFLARGIIYIAQWVGAQADETSNETKLMRLRRTETYLSVATAIVRVAVVAIVGYLVWRALSPSSNSTVAAVGAGTFFIVLGGATVGMLLRDITAGATMIIERWFTVGDFIKVEPFIDVTGVVERMTLRSTKLRSLSGEVVWLHNQQIHGVHVTPRGLRTEAVDVFVNDREKGERLIKEVIETIPTGTLLLAKQLRIVSTEKWGNALWRITLVGQTAPGREWLIEKYFVDALIEASKKAKDDIVIREPIVRHADEAAERKFKRAIRVANEQE